ncbi:MAG TPA: dethiobiotin synthase [Parafilimonas sp.]|nr:dethiobiotin synthase [Parafilimonas sp.]
MNTIFVTGIGTDVGKTVASAILCEALEADYWKPVQAGFESGTDAQLIQSLLTNKKTIVHPETYKLKLASSPHIAARKEEIKIDLDKIYNDYNNIVNREPSIVNDSTENSKLKTQNLIIEGAGGLIVPLNDNEFIIDLIKKLNAKVILVSKNYLGSINHSLLTASVCKQNNLNVLGWMFNENYMNYEEEIEAWSGYTKIATIPSGTHINATFVQEQALLIKHSLQFFLQ